MRALTCDRRADRLSADVDFPYRIALGERVRIETPDCFGGFPERPPVEGLGANPVTGPIFIEGINPGDTLAVDVEAIEVVGDGFIGAPGEMIRVPIDSSRGVATYAGHIELLLDPMIGTIGVAPAGEPAATIDAGAHGGNMDCNIVRQGTTVCFRAAVAGAGLGMGDMHAVMGDGEVSGQGLEAAALITITARRVPGLPVALPYGLLGDRFFIVGFGRDMHEAADRAQAAMTGLLTELLDLTDDLARRFLGLAVDLRAGWRGGNTPTVWLELPLSRLPSEAAQRVRGAVLP